MSDEPGPEDTLYLHLLESTYRELKQRLERLENTRVGYGQVIGELEDRIERLEKCYDIRTKHIADIEQRLQAQGLTIEWLRIEVLDRMHSDIETLKESVEALHTAVQTLCSRYDDIQQGAEEALRALREE